MEELNPNKNKKNSLKDSQKVGNLSSQKGKASALKSSQETNEEEDESEEATKGEELPLVSRRISRWLTNRKKGTKESLSQGESINGYM